jgi:hypothetical protein
MFLYPRMFVLFYYLIIYDEKRIWLILSQCLLGLGTLKGFNIIHRDIKGENIFITVDNKVKIGVLFMFTCYFVYFYSCLLVVLYIFIHVYLLFCIFFEGDFGVSRQLSFDSGQASTLVGTLYIFYLFYYMFFICFILCFLYVLLYIFYLFYHIFFLVVILINYIMKLYYEMIIIILL